MHENIFFGVVDAHVDLVFIDIKLRGFTWFEVY